MPRISTNEILTKRLKIMKNLEKILNNTLDKLAVDYENKFLAQSEYSDNALETAIEICKTPTFYG